MEEVSLRPASERNIKNRLDPPLSQDTKCEFKNHFSSFMKTPAAVKRGRSFSQPRGKDTDSGTENGGLSRGPSFKQQQAPMTPEQEERLELENHTKRFLQRKSLMSRPVKQSDDSGDDSLSLSVTHSSSKTADKEERDSLSCSEDELESSPVSNVVHSKPPLSKPVPETNGSYNSLRPVERRRRVVDSEAIGAEEDAQLVRTARRFERRQRSKSDITGLVSAGKELEEEKEEERREEEQKAEEERKNREENRKIRDEEIKARDEEIKVREEERKIREEERKNKERIQEEKREEERKLRRSAREKEQAMNSAVTETVRREGYNRQVEISRHSEPALASGDNYVQIGVTHSPSGVLEQATTAEEERTQRSRKPSVFEHQPVVMDFSTYTKVGNAMPKPFNLSRQVSRETEESLTATTTGTANLGSSAWGIPGSRLLSPPPQHEKKDKERSPKFLGDNKENRKSQTKEIRARTELKRSELQRGESGDVAQVEVSVAPESRRDSSSSTADILAACKSGLKRLTYRKTYARTRSHPLEEGLEDEAKTRTKSSAHSPERGSTVSATDRATRYTTSSSGSRIPNRPTTPGPYYGTERPVTPGPYRPFSPTPGSSISSITSPSLNRQNWKSSSQKYTRNTYSPRFKYGTHETFV